jgi:hypothetical protein
LVVQVVLAFFCPPLSFGERFVFVSDLWLFAWVAAFGLFAFRHSRPDERLRLLALITALSGLMTVVFLHGMVRPSFAPQLAIYLQVPRDDLFSFGKEAVVAARFLSWILAGIVVSRFALDLRKLERTLAGCALIAVVSMIAARFSPLIQDMFGALYRYDPHEANWQNRIYGVFRSPMEASTTLALSILLLAQSRSITVFHRIWISFFLLIGIYLSGTLTAFLALPIALTIAWAWKRPARAKTAVFAAGLVVFGIAAIIAWNSPTFLHKKENFLFRFKPWTVYWNASLERFDAFFFGYGFHPHFSDNIYVFLFSRGGAFTLLAALLALALWWKKHGSALTPLQRSIPLFFLISGLTVDSLILRPVVLILICVGIPLLNRER